MSTPTSRARYLRGGLVGACSALVTALAHTVGGGGVPQGSVLAVLVVICATVGAAAGGITLRGHQAQTVLIIAALCVGQAVGHLMLTVAGGHHGHSGWLLTAPMLSLHVAAAIVLGIVIGVVEHLCAVCESVLRWLRLFAVDRHRPAVAVVRRRANAVVVQSVLLCAGLGMRAPPQISFRVLSTRSAT